MDLDIAVQGRSFIDVYEALSHAVETYFEDAMAEAPADRDSLLARKSPLSARLAYALRILAKALVTRKDGSDDAQFTVHCGA